MRANTHTHTHAKRERKRESEREERQPGEKERICAYTFIQIAPGVVRILGRVQQGIIAVSTFAAGATLRDSL
jgi:hypothetical protein